MLILIVDDESNTRDALVRVLESRGHKTCWAATGEGALRLLRSEKPDLMLLDMLLPDRTGWDVRSEQLADPEISKIPVIVISGLGADVIRNPLVGVGLIMSKPVDVQRLLSVIDHLGALGQLDE